MSNSPKKLADILYTFQQNIDEEWAKFSKKHIYFCDKFDELENGTKEDAVKLASELLEEYGEQFYRLREAYKNEK